MHRRRSTCLNSSSERVASCTTPWGRECTFERGAWRIGMIGLEIALSTLDVRAQDAKPITVGKSMVDGNIRIESQN
jgi:hypothetical protein